MWSGVFKRWKDQHQKLKHSMASNITGPKDIQLLDCKHNQSAWGRSIISWGAGNMKTDCLLSKSDGFHWSFFTILQFIENLLANHIKPTRQNWNTTAKHKSSFFRNRLQCIAPLCTADCNSSQCLDCVALLPKESTGLIIFSWIHHTQIKSANSALQK